MYLSPWYEEKIKGCINSLRSNAAGYDDITAQVLKQTCDYIISPLTHIINLYFRCGVFPKS